ncbi:MAG: GtrA family protein, partial [Lachnospiraceae bacterium]|nr:GtrA family protein [Lachnospiraceae bacterium]
EWFNVSAPAGMLRPLHLAGTVSAVFIVCCIIDLLRTVTFNVIEDLCDWALGIYYAKKEVWDYLIAGFVATVVSWVTYIIFADYVFAFLEEKNMSDIRVLVGNAVSWTITVVFAYVINRIFVFHSEKTGFKPVMKEFTEFVAARLFSFGLEELIMFVGVTLLKWNDKLVKILIASIVVIIVNYILSKLWIFKAPAKEKDKKEE